MVKALAILIAVCMAATGMMVPLTASADDDGIEDPQVNIGRSYQITANQNDTGTHGSGGTTGTINKQTTAEGKNREYQLYVPSGIGSKPGPFPLIVFLHGAGGDKSNGAQYFGSKADSDGFLIASPTGEYQQSWREVYETSSSKQTYYDTHLIWKILNETFALYNIDLSHVWVSGFSDGATLTYRTGTLYSDMLSISTPQSGGSDPSYWANPSWAKRKIPFYARVGETDSSFRASTEQAQKDFSNAGHEFKLDIIAGWGHAWHSQTAGLFADFEKTRPLPHNWIRPALSFNQPIPGAKWNAGTKKTVEWWLGCGNPSYQVKLELSTNGPSGPWTLVDTITQQNWGLNQYEWNIPGSTPATTNAVLRGTITDSSNPQKTNVSAMNYTFEIVSGSSNLPPVVNAGPDQAIQLGNVAYLNGTATDPENDALTINWTKQSGPGTVTFADPKVAKTTATFSIDGDYVLKLDANDGNNPVVSDTVSVKVTPAPAVNHPPVLAAIGDKTVAEGDNLAFTIQATDPDQDPITYSASGLPKNSMFETSTKMFTFDPDYNQSGDHTVTFSASDGKGGSDSVAIKITVTNTNRVPVAKATAPTEVKVGTKVTLDGSTSSDPDGDALTYEWKQVSGAIVTITGATTANPAFTPQKAGTYLFQLMVRDDESPSSPVQVSIVAKSTGVGGTGNLTKTDNGFPGGTIGLVAVIGVAIAIVFIVILLLLLRRRKKPQGLQQGYGQQAYWSQPQDQGQQWDPGWNGPG